MDRDELYAAFSAFENGNVEGGWWRINGEIAWHSRARGPGDTIPDLIACKMEALRIVQEFYESYRRSKENEHDNS
jgi:hypothetical protein